MAPSFTARIQLFLLRALGFLIGLVGRAALVLGGPKFASKTPRPVTEPLLLLSGMQLAKLIRQRKVKCIDVVQAYINRIKDVNPMINGIVKYRFEEAMKEAHAVDQKLAEKQEDEATLENKWPFLGVPLTVKEAFQLQGGEGCTLAAACSVIGVGSDIGGSIRMPAFFNGIFGHKPSPGVVPNKGQFPLAVGAQELFLCTGPMCRYAEDLAPMLKVMAGPGIKRLKLDTKVHLKDLKFYWMEHDGGSFLMSKVDQDLIMTQKKLITWKQWKTKKALT
ncbi:fatty-acid amide hydrolase 2 isoform X11 [Homo sapiens]|uniref:fatty-acid amide hydrolase 2 isoform X11 n=1 Tax=Homo sapiens TaxID=9606 RepID=UPI001FB14416|nr:fatty-acid amide hydrolase 2 isoform X11 [Homo sapiens]XP_054182515.1 fatty-acid amide hydrolase 2 isoform X11 [Homo sapiens]